MKQSQIEESLLKNGNNIDEAIDYILNQDENDDVDIIQENSEFDDLSSNLMDMFPTVSKYFIEDALIQAKYDSEKAINLILNHAKDKNTDADLSTLSEIFQNTSIPDLKEALFKTSSLQDAVQLLSNPDTAPVKLKSKPIIIASSLSTTSINSLAPQSDAPAQKIHHIPINDRNDAEYYRKLAQSAHDQRVILYHEAAQAYRKTGLTGSGAAAYYSSQAHSKTIEMNRLNEIAAQKIISQMDNDPDMIDVHGLTVKEAWKFVEERVTQWHCRPTNLRHKKPFKIVTGFGKHSDDRRAKLYPAILKKLRNSGWIVEEDETRAQMFVRAG